MNPRHHMRMHINHETNNKCLQLKQLTSWWKNQSTLLCLTYDNIGLIPLKTNIMIMSFEKKFQRIEKKRKIPTKICNVSDQFVYVSFTWHFGEVFTIFYYLCLMCSKFCICNQSLDFDIYDMPLWVGLNFCSLFCENFHSKVQILLLVFLFDLLHISINLSC